MSAASRVSNSETSALQAAFQGRQVKRQLLLRDHGTPIATTVPAVDLSRGHREFSRRLRSE
eukprot:6548494-Prymnesium_polylepis.1